MTKKYNELDDEDYQDKSFESDGQTVHYKTTVVQPVDQEFINLNPKDQEFIKYSLGDADSLLQTLGNDTNILSYSAKDLDELLYRWNNKKYDLKYYDENQFVNAIGAAFGNCLNKEFNTIWSVISDEYGTDYACISTDEHSYQLFPFSSVWKAIEQNREDSLNAIILIVKKNMEDWKKKD